MEQSGMEYQDTLVVGRVNHHSIELSWAGVEGGFRLGPPETWTLFTLEMEDPKKHTFTTIYIGYRTQFTVEGLAPSALYKFRLKTSHLSGEILHSQDISVSTAREPINGRNLHQAVLLNDENELTRILHMNTVDVNAPDRMGFTPLMVATMRGFYSLVDILVQNGADVNKKNSSGKDRRRIVVHGCWTSGVNLDSDSYHWTQTELTPQVQHLKWAHNGHFGYRTAADSAINTLGEGSHLSQASCYYVWPLETNIFVSLMLASFCGHLDIVRYLRVCGAVWTAQDNAGCTALHWAVDGSHLLVIQHMIEDGCQVDVKDSISGWTPLMRVSVISGDAEVASLLLRAGANVNIRDRDGKTPLMIAVLNNHEDLVKLLLENGADHCVKNEFGSSATEMGKAFERTNIVRLLEGRSQY